MKYYFDFPPHWTANPYKSLRDAINALKDKGLLGKVITSDYTKCNSFEERSDFLSNYLQLVRFFSTLEHDPLSGLVKVKKGLFFTPNNEETRFRISQGVLDETITIEAPDLLIDYNARIEDLSYILYYAVGSIYDEAVINIYNFEASSEDHIRRLETRLAPEASCEYIPAKYLVGFWTSVEDSPGYGIIPQNAYTLKIKENNLVDLGGVVGDAVEAKDAKYDPWTHFIWYHDLIIAEVKSLVYNDLELCYYHLLSPNKQIQKLNYPQTILLKQTKEF